MVSNSTEVMEAFPSEDIAEELRDLDFGEGQLIVVRKPTTSEGPDAYLPCKSCLGFYKGDDLWKHKKKCAFKQHGTDKEANLYTKSVYGEVNKLYCERDEVGFVAKHDELIIQMGNCLYDQHGERQATYISTKMREIARLVLEVKINEPSQHGLTELITTRNFALVSSKSLASVGERKYNKINLLPLAEDLAMLRAYLDKNPQTRKYKQVFEITHTCTGGFVGLWGSISDNITHTGTDGYVGLWGSISDNITHTGTDGYVGLWGSISDNITHTANLYTKSVYGEVNKLYCERDEVGFVAKHDELIIQMGNCLYDQHGERQATYISTKMREIARLVLEVKINEPSQHGLTELITTRNFALVSSKSLASVGERKYNKINLLPLAEDLAMLRAYLDKNPQTRK
ncbi:predicted protein [Nematostella vectensis]|uniref:Uncharacterized protein n=1 Tax=Nematostella vectensis TaxID=45351 RepID=A7T017_NEMVE|nr:predicted protein [Nematostella vectensis]|eukprot:XP_001622793.1 predicted protein [Nematostella vectensis]